MSRDLDEDIWDNICSSDNEEEIEELFYPHYPSDQEETNTQIETSENISLLGNYEDINNERLFLEEVDSPPINHLINLITTNFFNEQSNLLEQNGFRINEDFGEVLIIGEDIILIDKHLGDFLIISTL